MRVGLVWAINSIFLYSLAIQTCYQYVEILAALCCAVPFVHILIVLLLLRRPIVGDRLRQSTKDDRDINLKNKHGFVLLFSRNVNTRLQFFSCNIAHTFLFVFSCVAHRARFSHPDDSDEDSDSDSSSESDSDSEDDAKAAASDDASKYRVDHATNG